MPSVNPCDFNYIGFERSSNPMSNKFVAVIFICVFIIAGCKNDDGTSIFKPKKVDPPSVQSSNNSYKDNIGRSSWQKPELVVNKLGDIGGKTIADIGSGTGYFTFRLAYLDANVIAIDIDPNMINIVESFKENLPSSIQNNVTTRMTTPENPGLEKEEVDKVIIINTASYIDNLSDYLKKLKSCIKKEGQLMIVDYKSQSMEIPAPSLGDRLSVITLQTMLKKAGFKNINVDRNSLEFQYIVTAQV